MGASVESHDHGAAALVKAFKSMRGLVLRVGILQGDDSHGGATVGEIAEFHEFGTETIPQRSFIRAWYDENFERNRALFKIMMARVTRGQLTQEQAFHQLGSLFVAQIQQRIVDGIPSPLADSTIKAKGSSTPLIDTGQLKASITYEVEVG